MTHLDNYSAFSRKMQALIDSAIENAVDFSMDMIHDSDEQDETTLSQFRVMVTDQAQFFMATEIDPEYGGIELPNRLKDAIAERVKDQVRIMFNFQGA